jgi:NodT family efflux transporter outer membrane factor (OMF) lipoprotein
MQNKDLTPPSVSSAVTIDGACASATTTFPTTGQHLSMNHALSVSPGMHSVVRMPRAICVLCLALLSGCQSLATVPDLQPPTPTQWRNAETGGADRNAARAPDLETWWHAFGDSQLDALVAQALADNLTVAQARSRLLAARALASAARAEFRPTLRTGTLATPDPDATTSYLQGSIDAQWEIGMFGRAQSTHRITRASVDAAAADLQGARVTLVAEVVRDYLTLRSAQQQAHLLEQIADASRARRAFTQRRRELGLAADSELARADADLEQANAASAEPRIRADASAQQLAVLCGRAEPPAELLAAGTLPALTGVAPATLPADLLRTRPDIRHAESTVLAAAGELGIARADLYPRLSLVGAITTSTTISGGEFGFGRAVSSFGPLIDMPLFDWGARRARVTAKEADLSAALDGYRETVLEAVAETETALATWHAQRVRENNLRSMVAARERDERSVSSGRRLGLADGMDQAAAAIALNQSRLELLEAEQAQALAYVALYKALGGAPPFADAVN